MSGDHFGHNCPKAKNKGGESRAMTPYPRRDRTPSRDRTNASQGNETFRRYHGYFGFGPRKVLVKDPVQGTPATAAEGAALTAPAGPSLENADTAPDAGPVEEDRGSRERREGLEHVTGSSHQSKYSANTNMFRDTSEDTSEEEAEFNYLSKLADSLPDTSSEEEDLTMEADPRYLRSQSLMRALLDPSSVDDTSEEEDSEGDERAKMEEEQVELDETVQQMMDMEISQRKDEGDMKGFEEGSKYRLEFNIWKTEREWELMKRHEAKSTPAAADEENNTQAEEEHREQ